MSIVIMASGTPFCPWV